MKNAVLNSLKQGRIVSGEALADELGVSRTSVWKYVKQLRREGYEIASSPRCGYSLVSVPDRLIEEEILAGLKTRVLGRKIVSLETIPSTQDHAKNLANKGYPEGTLVVAERQTGGRGRMGRTWVSPPGGLYFSIILRPQISISSATQIPLVAGVALLLAIECSTSLLPRLKWPNDLMIGERKAAGILAEMNAEVDRINWVVLGIGINVNTAPSDFPADIKGMSVSLSGGSNHEVSRLKLLQDVLYELEKAMERFQYEGFEPFRLRWKNQSATLGRNVMITGGGDPVEGKAVDIDIDGALILEQGYGSRRRIITGDVSLMGSGD
ncbi:MAG: biotin--[acetyl-CoA-carboxylase] ligase [Syntrophales bacterium]|nr:biotin--[acetyl-CoA-carboxylase] ligase [Syntrophales bacterium]